MRTGRAELKKRARQAMKGNYGTAIGSMLLMYVVFIIYSLLIEIVMVICGMFSMTFYQEPDMEFSVSLAAALGVLYCLAAVLMYLLIPGLICIYMKICKGEKAHVGDLFWAFTNKPLKFLGIGLAVLGIAAVSAAPVVILLIAAGISGEVMFPLVFIGIYQLALAALFIYALLTFSMFYYILVEDPQKGIIQALKESRELMRGNRIRYLMLLFSFVGWLVLGALSYGIGMLWLMPYISCTMIFFYMDLKPQIETIPPDHSWNSFLEEAWEEQKGSFS